MKPAVLIMTATVSPPINCPDLIRSDPQIRLNDYCEALDFYLKISSECIDRIIFVENSNYDIGKLRDLSCSIKHGKTVEFISYLNGNLYPPEYGKGYGEMTMMDYAIDNSKIVDRDDVFWKATGRLILKNIEELIRNSPKNYDVYCDLHSEISLFSLKKFFDPRFYSFTIKGYDNYFRVGKAKLVFSHIEHMYYDILTAESHGNNIVPRFKKQPIILGFAGAKNDKYHTSIKLLQRNIQQILRYLAPNFWL